uniref:Putative Rhodanese-related sulfurtransferase n=1 Tax=mine drainage metagenome TaxID=410659 RepID=E6PV32_9ZZZZ
MSVIPTSTSNPAPDAVLNISAYKFVGLDDFLPARRERLLARCQALALKGTILLAPEGINLFLAGAPQALDALLAALRADPLLADLQAKRSWSAAQPFRRMKVKLKREIITLNRPQIRPAAERAPAVSPGRLKRWLDAGCDDEGRPVVMLDTRNVFERELGGFDGCVDFGIARFSDFAPAVETQAARFAGQTVVAYCTGGIRCEKAALLMRGAGIERVYQLDGGILDYFEQVGGAHYSGGCFVFDERTALDSALAPRGEAAQQATHPLQHPARHSITTLPTSIPIPLVLPAP